MDHRCSQLDVFICAICTGRQYCARRQRCYWILQTELPAVSDFLHTTAARHAQQTRTPTLLIDKEIVLPSSVDKPARWQEVEDQIQSVFAVVQQPDFIVFLESKGSLSVCLSSHQSGEHSGGTASVGLSSHRYFVSLSLTGRTAPVAIQRGC